MPVLEQLRLVVQVCSEPNRSTNPPRSMHAISAGEDAIQIARQSFLANTDTHFTKGGKKRSQSPSASSHPSSFRVRQQDPNLQMACGRPREVEETIPLTLLYPAFGQFIDDSQSCTYIPTEEDNNFIGSLAHVMSAMYENEDQRREAVSKVLNGYNIRLSLNGKVRGTRYITDGNMSMTVDDRCHPYVIVEFKNETAGSGSEPYIQAAMYYLQATRTYAATLSGSALPCFLLIIFGPTIVFASAVWTLRPVIQILSTPISFNFHSLDRYNHVTAVRHMAAFRKAVQTLETHYQTLPHHSELVSKLSHPTIFPYPTTFTSLDDNSTIAFKYMEHFHENGQQSKRLIFFGTLNEGDAQVPICIKFVQEYSRDAHIHCAAAGLAPKLRGFEQLPGGWYMVVMDRLIGYDQLADVAIGEQIPKSVFDRLGDCLRSLHSDKLVHGDIRDTNIMLKTVDRTNIMIIDFDWAGVEGVVRYPAFVNYKDIQRPDDARDGQHIKAAHDEAMLGFLMAKRSQK
ncbi:hypothetical protein DEU56DRAFT_874522 [Suillus clintonianus]|uniref:uncharacterized protein n=1 Tax=Suillus clintonianus TaxID=1904413 RepID=UPI001B8869D8|nr:uncharacterized protein DEU56DRAFT_874522 [Suillus clintonianus]KAG2108873.1 hypothetical protein DEU56DRAFT_874522 [Suillus clintonianus]